MMTELFQRVALLSLSCSAVLLPLLMCSRWMQDRYTAQSCYILWLFLALRLLVPIQLTLPRPVVTLPAPAAYVSGGGAGLPVPARTGWVRQGAEVLSQAPAVDWMAVLAAVWLTGIAAVLLWHASLGLQSRRYLLARAVPDRLARAELDELRAELGVARVIPVCRTCRVETPMTLGLIAPVILLPEGDGGGSGLELILRHELGHIRRRDLWYKALLLVVSAVHWFNPLVWLMGRQAGRNLEYCCDDMVVAGRDADFRHRYGRVLLRHAARGEGPVWVTRFGDSGERLKGRLMNLFHEKRTGALLISLVLLGSMLCGGLVACERAGGAGVSPIPGETLAAAEPSGETAPPEGAGADDPAVSPAEPSFEPGDGWQWPAAGACQITAPFGRRVHPITGKSSDHGGVDIAAPEGTEVQAARGGYVLRAEYDAEYGNCVEVMHDNGVSTCYAQLSEADVEAGEVVTQGQVIGAVGSTGSSTGAHLHLEFRVDGVRTDPLSYYPQLPVAYT